MVKTERAVAVACSELLGIVSLISSPQMFAMLLRWRRAPGLPTMYIPDFERGSESNSQSCSRLNLSRATPASLPPLPDTTDTKAGHWRDVYAPSSAKDRGYNPQVLSVWKSYAQRCLTSRAQARGADDVLRDSGTGTAIPRCLQRFVRPTGHALLSKYCFASGLIQKISRGMQTGKQQLLIPKQITTKL